MALAFSIQPTAGPNGRLVAARAYRIGLQSRNNGVGSSWDSTTESARQRGCRALLRSNRLDLCNPCDAN
jgi:hypothetical protein